MNMTYFRRFVLFCFFLASQSIAMAQTVVIGYLPTYHGLIKEVEQVDLTKITHLTLAFLHPNKQGRFSHNNQPTCMFGELGKALKSEELLYTVKKAHQANVKVLISFGGASYPNCAGDWKALLAPDKRESTIENLFKFVENYNFDGLDMDLEGSLLMEIHAQGNFLPFMQQLSEKLLQQNKLLTAATGSYIGGMLPKASLKYFDYVSLMSYDAVGPTWGSVGVEHSTFAKAKDDIKLWESRGLAKEKLLLGLPFYGYGFGKYEANYTFDEIIREFGDKLAEGDLVGENCSDCNYVTFNGYQSIQAKTKLALKHGAGVMIWELSKDHKGQFSLLNIIDAAIKNHSVVH